MKDGKVFHQWLVTLDHIQASTIPGKASTGRVLRALTLNMSTIYETLGLLDMVIMAEKGEARLCNFWGWGSVGQRTLFCCLLKKDWPGFPRIVSLLASGYCDNVIPPPACLPAENHRS